MAHPPISTPATPLSVFHGVWSVPGSALPMFWQVLAFAAPMAHSVPRVQVRELSLNVSQKYRVPPPHAPAVQPQVLQSLPHPPQFRLLVRVSVSQPFPSTPSQLPKF